MKCQSQISEKKKTKKKKINKKHFINLFSAEFAQRVVKVITMYPLNSCKCLDTFTFLCTYPKYGTVSDWIVKQAAPCENVSSGISGQLSHHENMPI